VTAARRTVRARARRVVHRDTKPVFAHRVFNSHAEAREWREATFGGRAELHAEIHKASVPVDAVSLLVDVWVVVAREPLPTGGGAA
jgi:hypothetical protein